MDFKDWELLTLSGQMRSRFEYYTDLAKARRETVCAASAVRDLRTIEHLLTKIESELDSRGYNSAHNSILFKEQVRNSRLGETPEELAQRLDKAQQESIPDLKSE